ncbi:MAG TPA: HAD family phosphatase [Ignavibacteria bacterium]|nr:HAD family phosphatase [Ignavibacteria bacterium]HMR41140.1 HAD family phosphatase [Ignavibacteria bacterium]
MKFISKIKNPSSKSNTPLQTKIQENLKEIKCIIFDCDGVLVDSEEIGTGVLLSMAKEFGLRMTLEEAMMNFSGRSLKDCLNEIENRTGQKLPEDFTDVFRKKTFEKYESELQPVKGVKEFIESLTISFCVASSGPMDKIRSNLSITGLAEKFGDNVFSSYLINSWKPDPEIFLHAAKEMGFSPKECIVIEDSKAGVISAKRGGFTVYALANENNSQILQTEGAIIFYRFEELDILLNSEKNTGS